MHREPETNAGFFGNLAMLRVFQILVEQFFRLKLYEFEVDLRKLKQIIRITLEALCPLKHAIILFPLFLPFPDLLV